MGAGQLLVVDLADDLASDPTLAGAKAANIARCATQGLPTLPGFALTTTAASRGLDDPDVIAALRRSYQGLVGDRAGREVVVRSSSTIEDAGSSSMAGQFTSVLDVVGWDSLLAATKEVLASADAVRDGEGVARPIAVLVQRQLDSPLGGVMFGVDPVTGDRSQIVVEAVPSRPDTLVGGEVTAAHYVLDRRGRIREQRRTTPETALPRPLRRELVALAEQGARTFGGPQDIEWAIDRDGALWLLQSRPVTAVAPHGGRGHVFGPGPVAETFPEPLQALEVELFAIPMRDGIVRALRTAGAATEHQLAASPVLTTLEGRVAVDLELLGITRGHRTWRSMINPAVLVRRLVSAWRVGRARTALPALGAQVVATVDHHLEAIGPLADLTPSELLDLLEGARRELTTTHAYEILAGMLLHRDHAGASGAAVALGALTRARADGGTDAQIIARHPEVLALVPPAIAAGPGLPPAPALTSSTDSVDDLGLREALRLRCRWLQELAARAALELGRRLTTDGRLAEPGQVRHLTLPELHAALADGALPADLTERATRPGSPPLPDAFRLSASGEAVPARHRGPVRGGGIPAGGGRVAGTARHRVAPGSPRSGAILITRHLEPQLAPLLPSLDGLVSETGSALSHLAILARELQVPTVVGVHDALVRFPPGTRLLVDGTTGEVAAIDDEEPAP